MSLITRRGLPLTAALAIMIVAGACGGSAPAAPSAGDAGVVGMTTTYEGVSTVQGATVVDAVTGARDLKKVDDNGTLHFAGGSSAAKAAKAGEVLVLEGSIFRKVTSVSEANGEILIQTEEATLGEFIKNGKVGWDYDVDWMNLPTATYDAAAKAAGLEPTLVASTSNVPPAGLLNAGAPGEALVYTGKIEGFDVEVRFTPKPGQLDFSMSAKRANAKLQAKGFITGFNQSAEIEYQDSTASVFEAAVDGLSGEAELSWAAYQVAEPALNSAVMGIEVPLALPIPFAVGPVPMTLTIKMNIRIVPALEAVQASSGGSFKVAYDAQQGFVSKAGGVTPKATVSSFAADLGSTETVTAGLGPVGFGFGLEFPRLELALGTPLSQKFVSTFAYITFNQYVNGMWTPGTTLSSDIPPCQRASLKVSAISGYRMSILNLAEVTDKTTLWERTLDKFKDNKPCTLTGEAP